MSHFEDDEPIKTRAASQAYRDNWDRIFGEPSDSSQDVEARQVAPASDVPAGLAVPRRDLYEKVTVETDADAIEMRLKLWGWHCNTCDKIVYDPENHQYHAIIKLSDD